ncbi:hypothetical protein OR1_02404 [Geobacter sp. OR-1]|uniref:tetratricopeptide repeat protein n=1 Tax=Geobacter sp. OR-1 TaxID=1266765 RepID=UPI000543753A|nr:tetratricopeptide repeat protein [Geobacter sp. OR-1]GAM10116.1 hypothetical protein OR1_02404 [Geobacter sp. OR-1]
MLNQDRIQELVKSGRYDEAAELCREEVEREPAKSDNYLFLGRILMAADRKREAIRVFSDGLAFEDNAKIRHELNQLGRRRFRIISSLSREHLLNRILGKISHTLKLSR